MKILKKIANIFYSIMLFALVLLLLGTVFSLVEAPGGVRLFIVQSGSMEPFIKTGSMAVTKPQSAYQEGDVVSFIVKSNSNFADYGQTVMHRIVSATGENEDISFTTKGDANQGNDPDPVLPSRIKGKVIFSLPYAGYAISYARTKIGFALLIVLPAVMIVISEMMNIKREISKMVADKKAKKKSLNVMAESKNSKKGRLAVTKAVAVIVLCLLSLSSGASALLTDEEKAIGVVLSVGTWGDGPQLDCDFRGQKNMFHFGIEGWEPEFQTYSYELLYITNDITHSVEGENIPLATGFEKDIFLGSSSDDVWVEDDNFGKLELNVTLERGTKNQLQCRYRWREHFWESL